MIDARTKMLTATISKLYRRGAEGNIRRILQKTHTADIAALLEALDTEERLSIFQLVHDLDQKSQIVAYLNEDRQEEILSVLDTAEIEKIVSNMERDDAADLLGHLPDDVSKRILNAMVQEDSEEVEELMGYPEDSAGGIMSSEVLAMKEEMTVSDVVKAIQKEEEDLIAFYIYVVNDSEQLVGVLSLKQLLLSRPSMKLKDIMSTDIITVALSTNQAEVARIVERYDFLSLPVVDESNKLVGVITVDDVIDVIREEAEEDFLAMGRAGWTGDADIMGLIKARWPWLVLSFIGSSFCFSLIFFITFFGQTHLKENLWWLVAAFVPIILVVGATAGHQSATFAVGILRSRADNNLSPSKHILKEMAVSGLFALVFCSIVVLTGFFVFDLVSLAWILGLSLSFQIIFSVVLGSSIPFLLKRLGLDPTVASMPLLTAIADISGITVLFGSSQIFLDTLI